MFAKAEVENRRETQQKPSGNDGPTIKKYMMATVVAEKPNGRQCRLLKITEYLKKKPGVTDEQFHAHWNGQHVNIAMESELFRRKVRKYNQYHIRPEDRALAAKLGVPVLPYDGVAEVWVDSLEDWQEVIADRNFLATIFPDEELFLQKPVEFMFGYETLVIAENDTNEDARDLRLTSK